MRKTFSARLGLLGLALLLGAGAAAWRPCSAPRLPTIAKPPTTDGELEDAIRQAVALGLGPKEAEDFVGLPAAINTAHFDERRFGWCYSLEDCMRSPFPDEHVELVAWLRRLFSSQTLAYWWYPTARDRHGNSKIVGIAWDERGKPRSFRGSVAP